MAMDPERLWPGQHVRPLLYAFLVNHKIDPPPRYMQGFKCTVTGASPTAKLLAKAQVPIYCENEPEKCIKGAKQMLAWHQATGNNIETAEGVTPNYNQKCGWAEGAQKDIFENSGVQEAVARPHPWSVNSSSDAVEAKVARPHPWRVSSSSDEIDTKVARPHPWSVENDTVELKVARPHPWKVADNVIEPAAARPHPWSVNASSVIVPSGAASSSTLAAHVITSVITPTSAQDAVSATSVPAMPTKEVSCSARRPRYTPNVRHR
jgi:hypothetical protein